MIRSIEPREKKIDRISEQQIRRKMQLQRKKRLNTVQACGIPVWAPVLRSRAFFAGSRAKPQNYGIDIKFKQHFVKRLRVCKDEQILSRESEQPESTSTG